MSEWMNAKGRIKWQLTLEQAREKMKYSIKTFKSKL